MPETRTASLPGVLGDTLYRRLRTCKVLVVGAGGIGCELLKNLALSGFKHIHVIDLDTIEVTNLNRQFLFQKQHVGKSKAQVARESVLKFNPELDIVAHHANVFSNDFDLAYFEQFDLVLNALDNLAARNHVNRMCLSANVPLIESGSAGYLGQVHVIRKGVTECYECNPKPARKQYPACTIRNTPTAMIHCIVWAKFLFNHLFGISDHENDVAPDTNDPELKEQADQQPRADASGDGTDDQGEQQGQKRVNTRAWAESIGYDPARLLNKLFCDDVKVLLGLEGLWKKRKKPQLLDLEQLQTAAQAAAEDPAHSDVLPDQKVWSQRDCVEKFLQSTSKLRARFQSLGDNAELPWDKDDDDAMDFVCAASNLRAYTFDIKPESRFDVKSKAGNIIPAIATTNATVAGLIVLQAYKLLHDMPDKCRAVYVGRTAMGGNRVLNSTALCPPNPKCIVCGDGAVVHVFLNIKTATVELLAEQVLKKTLSLAAPEVVLPDGKVLISAPDDEEDREIMETRVYPRTLAEFDIIDGTQCSVADDLQRYKLKLIIRNKETIDGDQPFEVTTQGKLEQEEEQPVKPTKQGTSAQGCLMDSNETSSTAIVIE